MNLISLALSALIAFAPAPPIKEVSSYHPLAEVRFAHEEPDEEQHLGEIIFFRDLEAELSRFIGDERKLITTDARFVCLPEEQVRGMIKNLLFTFDNRYIVEARDCDDLAWEFIVKLRRFSRDVTDEIPVAASVGFIGVKLVNDIPEMGYFLEGGVGYHAVVIVRCMDGKWLLVDPGTKKVSELTQHLYEGSIELRLVIF